MAAEETIEGVPCWAEDLALVCGRDPGLIAAAHCAEPHVYLVLLDDTVWAEKLTLLCAEHTARIRALAHGGVLGVALSLPAEPEVRDRHVCVRCCEPIEDGQAWTDRGDGPEHEVWCP